ncbi:MAG: transporter substrate-binding domain-containing protein [Pseudomonadota bacterium]|nr:transporter substrate-binding domain-containing protein [Pseudomonadota bacterium]
MNKRISSLFTLFAMLFFCAYTPLAGAQQQAIGAIGGAAAQDLVTDVRFRGTLHVGVSPFIPWAMNTGQGGLMGFEIDVAKQLAEVLGADAAFEVTSWDNIIPDLLDGKFDIIISGLSITPQRALEVNFSNPYAESSTQLLANRKLAQGFAGIEDFNQPEVKLAVRKGSPAEGLAARTFPAATLVLLESDTEIVRSVVDEKAHAAITSSPRPEFEMRRHADALFLPLSEPLASHAEAFAVRKGDPDALAFLNAWIDSHTRNGWLERRRDYWFNGFEWTENL